MRLSCAPSTRVLYLGSAAVGAGGAGAVLVVSFGAFAFVSRDRMRVAR